MRGETHGWESGRCEYIYIYIYIYIYTFLNHLSNGISIRSCHHQPSTAATLTHGYPAPEVGNDCEDFDQYGWTQVRGWLLKPLDCI